MDTVSLKQETAQEIINYLQTRPYAEVFKLVGKILEEARKPTVVEEAKEE